MFHLAEGPLRFGELRRRVVGISEKILIAKLRELEADDIVARRVEAEVPPRVTYSMTRHGRTLCPLIEAMAAWGARLARRAREDQPRREP